MRAFLLCLVGLMTASSDIALAEIKLNTKPAADFSNIDRPAAQRK